MNSALERRRTTFLRGHRAETDRASVSDHERLSAARAPIFRGRRRDRPHRETWRHHRVHRGEGTRIDGRRAHCHHRNEAPALFPRGARMAVAPCVGRRQDMARGCGLHRGLDAGRGTSWRHSRWKCSEDRTSDMAGLDPAIRVFGDATLARRDARPKAGHDS